MAESETPAGGKQGIMACLSVHGWVSVAFGVLAVIFYLLIPYQIEKPKLLFGRSFMDMEPTLFPKLAAAGLFVMCALAVIESLRAPEANPFKGMGPRAFGKMAGLLCILYLFALIFEPLGFLISGVFIVGLLSFYLGNRNPYTLVLLALGVPGTVYFVFTNWLNISLPEGILY